MKKKKLGDALLTPITALIDMGMTGKGKYRTMCAFMHN